MSLQSVVIIGRPNVGKSTLFNRIVGSRRAVVHETAGVTRDRIVQQTDWAGFSFLLMDTGGIIPFGETVSHFDQLVSAIALEAVEQADVVLFLVDGQTGPTNWDEAIAASLRRKQTPVVLAVNKVEKDAVRLGVADFYKLGLGEPFAVSALHGIGVGDLMDQVVTDFPPSAPETACDCRIAIVGRPNVGKSSLLNALVGREEALVSEIPGTTRDAIHTDLRWHGRTLRLIDTAGLRRKTRVKEAIEAFSAMRTVRALAECHVAVLMIDASCGAVAQDARIAGQIHDAGKGVVIAFNKWDLVEKDHATYRATWDEFLRNVPFLTYAPWFTFSALSHQRLGRILETVWEVHESRQKRIDTSELNQTFAAIVKHQQPRHHAGGVGKIYYATQAGTAPPVFVVSVNNPALFARDYLRYLNNQLRKKYGFTGSRLFIKLKKH
ncbi:MAG: ribosome biogenesis GTPase Der [bacterium]